MTKRNIILKNKIQELANQLNIFISHEHLDSLADRKLQRYKAILQTIITSHSNKVKRFQEFIIKDEAMIKRNREAQLKEKAIIKLASKGFKQNHIARRFNMTPARVCQIIINNK